MMKKYLGSLFVLLFTCALTLTPVNAAYDTTKLDQAYNKAVSYYQQKSKKGLESYDDILASESVGVEADQAIKAEETLNEYIATVRLDDQSKADIGALGKNIVLTCLMGKDPKNINGVNLVEELEKRVRDDGSIVNSTGANNDIWALNGLYVVNSTKQNVVGKRLAKEALNNGAYWYEYPAGVKCADADTTGWAIETLSLVNKTAYKTTIDKAVAFLRTATKNINNQSVFTQYDDGNANTQGAVLEGLAVADRNGLLNDQYNALNAANPYDYLLTWQLDDGSFKAENYDVNYQPLGIGYNNYATRDGVLALGTYKNGSVFDKAKRDYDKTLHPVKNYQITSDQDAKIQNNQDYILTTNLPSTNIQSILVDGKKLAASDYNVNTSITLSAHFLKSLPDGKHTLVIEGTDGNASTTFTLFTKQTKPAQVTEAKTEKKAEIPGTEVKKNTEAVSKKKTNKVVDTGDDTDIIIWIMGLVVGLSGLILLRRYRYVEKA